MAHGVVRHESVRRFISRNCGHTADQSFSTPRHTSLAQKVCCFHEGQVNRLLFYIRQSALSPVRDISRKFPLLDVQVITSEQL